MLQTLAITGPIYLVIALGFLAGRAGTFTKLDMRVLGTYVVKFALPALVFTALSQRPVGEVMNGRYVLGYAIGSLIVMLGAFGWAWRWRGTSFTLSALFGLGSSSSNSGFIGYPIAILVAGPSSAAVGLAMCMLVENLLMIPLTLVMADTGRAGAGKWHRILVQSLFQLSRNPVILAIGGGLVVSLVGIPITGVLARSINMLAMSSAAVSLFVIGGTLVGLRTKGMRRDVTTVAFGKLVLHPLAVGLMMWLLPPSDSTLRAAAVVFAATPMLSIYPILAQRYGFDEMCAAALLLATVMSFASISVVLWLLGPILGWAA
ncbi:MAG: AEC family transporter [Proteobacteria bacterium]|nr:AEC family transporter [Pseudomonadota bacterium]